MIFFTGLLIFMYPIVSNWLSSREHYTVISEQNELLKQMTAVEIEKERQKAKKYNDSINETSIPIADPFSDELPEEIASSYFNVLDIGKTIGSIEIPTIHMELPIYHGVSEDVLQRGIGHMSNSSFPIGGLGTHTALTGHRGLPSSKLFRDLDKMEMEDIFYIHTLDETLAYQVDDIKIVLPNEIDWLQLDETKDYATLITCEPYMINTHRLLVRGERIPYEDAVTLEDTTSVKQPKKKFPLILIFIGIVSFSGVIYFYIRRKRTMKE